MELSNFSLKSNFTKAMDTFFATTPDFESAHRWNRNRSVAFMDEHDKVIGFEWVRRSKLNHENAETLQNYLVKNGNEVVVRVIVATPFADVPESKNYFVKVSSTLGKFHQLEELAKAMQRDVYRATPRFTNTLDRQYFGQELAAALKDMD